METASKPDAFAFENEGVPHDAGGDRPLLLRGDRAWIVRSGRLDVYAARMRGTESVGYRTHLFRVEAGGAVFGLGDGKTGEGLALLAVGAPGCTVGEIDLGHLDALSIDPGSRQAVAELVDGWVEGAFTFLAGNRRVRRFHLLNAGAPLEVPEGVTVHPEPRVGWIEQRTGSALLLGRAGAEIGPGETFPISRSGWLETAEPSVLALTATGGLLELGAGPLVWGGMARLNAELLATVEERTREADEAQRERQRVRRHEADQVMETALSQIVATLAGPDAQVRLRPAAAGREDALLAAFRLVTESAGIRLDSMGGRAWANRKNPVDALAQSCRVHVRRVVLREGWWHGAASPLLGRLAEGERPVALLPLPGGGYEVCDPVSRKRLPVDAEVAATLGPFAYTVYRPFAPEPLRVWDVVRFALFGSTRDLLRVFAAGGAVALLGLVTPVAVAALFNEIIPGAEREQLLQMVLLLAVCALAAGSFHVVRGLGLLRIETRSGADLQAAVWDRLLALPLPFFRNYSAGDLAMRAMGMDEIRRTLSGTTITVLLTGVFSFSNFLLLFYFDVRLAILAAGLIIVALGVVVVSSWFQLRVLRTLMELRSRISGVVLQLLTGIAKLKGVGAEVPAFGSWARLFSEQRRHRFHLRTMQNRVAVYNMVFPVVCSLVLFAAVAGVDDPLGTGDFLAFLTAFNLALMAILSTSNAVLGSLAVVPLYEQVKPILRTQPEVSEHKTVPAELAGAIELQHVSFRYHADGPLVLRDVSVRIRPGEFVAFVGPSGSGKSTLLRLLLGFETPEGGAIFYDEQDLSGLDVQSVRRQIGAVLQSGKLMGGDIYTNIVGSSLATLDDAWEAARQAGLEEDIRQMPMGMHTLIHESGGTLSGGQFQRVMIARALVNRPRILFFDEATSALDNRTQDVVSRSLAAMQTTRVVIAHRLSTIAGADRVYVVDGGEIVESGSYAELMVRGGAFTEMARRQLV